MSRRAAVRSSRASSADDRDLPVVVAVEVAQKLSLGRARRRPRGEEVDDDGLACVAGEADAVGRVLQAGQREPAGRLVAGVQDPRTQAGGHGDPDQRERDQQCQDAQRPRPVPAGPGTARPGTARVGTARSSAAWPGTGPAGTVRPGTGQPRQCRGSALPGGSWRGMAARRAAGCRPPGRPRARMTGHRAGALPPVLLHQECGRAPARAALPIIVTSRSLSATPRPPAACRIAAC